MTDWLLVTIGTVIAVEVFLRTPFKRVLNDLTRAAQKAHKTLSAKFVSDHWKEAVLPRYASTILKNSILLFACLVLTILPVVLIDLIGVRFDMETLATMTTGRGIVYSILTASLYALIRAQVLNRAEYSPLQKLLHYLALSSAYVGEASFDIEMRTNDFKTNSVDDQPHVFVTGLARAGTTILMRSIYATGQFASLTYADMPFVLAPNLWSKIAGKSEPAASLKERAHGDGIMVNYDSPEAFDEVFWQVFVKNDYVTKDGLRAHDAGPEVIQNYRRYVCAIANKYKKSRYISKNNNNVLRLESIHRAFPNATVLIPFRDPRQHAFSLLRQHQMFLVKQRQDPFVRRYMSWLGHYEFGSTHKRFRNEMTVFRITDTNSIDYWLEQWITVYRFLLDHPLAGSGKLVFLSYERMCQNSDRVWRKLCSLLDLEHSITPDFIARVSNTPQPDDRSLVESATETYTLLDRKCRDSLELQTHKE